MKIKYIAPFLLLSMAVYASIQAIQNTDGEQSAPMALQTKVEPILDSFKQELEADEVIAVVMDSKSGKILSMTSSNRVNQNSLLSENNSSLNNGAIEYSTEQGAVMMPIVYSLLFDKGLVNSKELINCHDGNYTLGVKTILDEQKFKSLSAEDVIVHSSNIGMVQLAQRLYGKEYTDGLNRFGFGHFSGIDLPHERSGSIPTSEQLDNYLYKAIVSYGYGVSSNTMQMVKAYNVFNNNGRMVTPFINQSSPMRSNQFVQVVSPETANTMKQILIKTVNEGTGAVAKTQGLEIGGKTGTAYIAKNGAYTNSYRTSFVGFANDDKQSYTIAITVINPKASYYASTTSVPVFKAIVNMMVEKKYFEKKF